LNGFRLGVIKIKSPVELREKNSTGGRGKERRCPKRRKGGFRPQKKGKGWTRSITARDGREEVIGYGFMIKSSRVPGESTKRCNARPWKKGSKHPQQNHGGLYRVLEKVGHRSRLIRRTVVEIRINKLSIGEGSMGKRVWEACVD